MTRYNTPGTRIFFSNLAEWCDNVRYAVRRSAARRHVRALPLALVTDCNDADALHRLLDELIYGWQEFCRPPRGSRGNAPHTPLIVAAKNRIAQLQQAAAREGMAAGANWCSVHGSDR